MLKHITVLQLTLARNGIFNLTKDNTMSSEFKDYHYDGYTLTVCKHNGMVTAKTLHGNKKRFDCFDTAQQWCIDSIERINNDIDYQQGY